MSRPFTVLDPVEVTGWGRSTATSLTTPKPVQSKSLKHISAKAAAFDVRHVIRRAALSK
jgi:hypothetical protein